jgi:glucose/arabinose dehydrogenase
MRRVRRTVLLALVLGGVAACTDQTRPLQPRLPAPDRGERGADAVPGPSPMLGDGPAVGLRLVAGELVHPVAFAESPDGTGRRFIVDQVGVIRVLLPNGTLLPQPFLDLRAKITPLMPPYDERGLLGLAFHPGFATNGRFFVYYTAPPRVAGFDNTSTVSEFHAGAGANVADAGSERIVLQVDHPQFNHEAGTLAFGPDHMLYISIGDGGNANDVGLGHVADWYAFNEGGNGQDVTHNLLGNILRLDVDGARPYAIPADNPFVGKPGRDEIWAYGFRNPYRFSFDRGGTHQLYVGDAGQNMWEEADIVVRGGNYGWNVKEGAHCFDVAHPFSLLASCPSVDTETGDRLIDPIIEIPNEENAFFQPGIVVIIGGYVYRGTALPELAGRYVFGAFSEDEDAPEGVIFRGIARPNGLWAVQELPIANTPSHELGHYVLGFGEDLKGELYVLTTDNAGPTGRTGKVFQLVAPGSAH